MKTLLHSLSTITLTVLFLSPAAWAEPGDLDPLDAGIASGPFRWHVAAAVVQPDGKLIIAGEFPSVLGVPRSNIARLNADGTLDTGFNPSASGTVFCVALQADDKVLLGGNFLALQPGASGPVYARQYLARVNADGTLDESFDPAPDEYLTSVAVQADGKVLLAGHFTALQPNGAAAPVTRRYIARVHADGSLDTAFDPNADNNVAAVAVQADGKVLPGGVFTTLQPNGAPQPVTRRWVLIDDAATLKARDNSLIGTTTRRFLRVKVTAAP